MKFSFSLSALSLLALSINTLALPSASVEERGLTTATDGLTARNAIPAFDGDDGDDIPDALVADVEFDDDDEFYTPDELEQLKAFRALSDADVDKRDLAERSPELEERGIKGTILKFLLKKIKKSALGKRVWNKMPKSQRKRITKYVKKAGKGTKKSKNYLRKEIRPVLIDVLKKIIGATAAKIIVDDVIPWVIDVIMLIIF